MLNSISWSQFFTAIAIVAAIYYGITIILLYSSEIKSFFKKGSGYNAGSSSEESDVNLIGQIRSQPERQSREQYVASDALMFSGNNQPEDPAERTDNDELLTGAVADLLEDIKAKLVVITEWNKDEALPAFRELLLKYPQLKGTVYQESINFFIANKCPDHFSWTIEPEEVNTLWS